MNQVPKFFVSIRYFLTSEKFKHQAGHATKGTSALRPGAHFGTVPAKTNSSSSLKIENALPTISEYKRPPFWNCTEPSTLR